MDHQRNNKNRLKKNSTLLILILLIFLLWSSFASARNGRAQSPFQVGLVVQLNQQTITRCVNLTKDNPTGYDVLLASGLDLITSASGMGVTVCSIAGTGCPSDNCFCQSYSAPYYYWSYWHFQNGSWVYSNLGASNYKVTPQSVEGWIWGDGKNAPALVDYAAICPAATDTPTISVTPSPSSTPTMIPVRNTKRPTATNMIYSPTAINSPTTAPGYPSVSPHSPSIRTPSTTPSITLAYALINKVSSTPKPSTVSEIKHSPTPEINLQDLGLTATALELDRRSNLTSSTSNSLHSGLLNAGFLAFLIMAGVLFFILIGLLILARK